MMTAAHCLLGCSLLVLSCGPGKTEPIGELITEKSSVANARIDKALLSQAGHSTILFLVIDTLDKSPGNYQYALISSDAGLMNAEVLILKDSAFINDKLRSGQHIIVKTLEKGETMESKIRELCSGTEVPGHRKKAGFKLAAE